MPIYIQYKFLFVNYLMTRIVLTFIIIALCDKKFVYNILYQSHFESEY